MSNQQIKNIGIVVVLVAIVGGGAYYLGKSQSHTEAPEVVTIAEEPLEDVVTEESNKIQHPIPVTSEQNEAVEDATKATTESKDIGTQIVENWRNFFGTEAGSQFIYSENFIHRFVMMFENATEPKIPTTASIFEPVFGEFLVKTENEKAVLSVGNYQRYDQYIALLKTANVKKIASFYVKAYPLFQAAYKEMGTDAYFNDRVVTVLDKVIHATQPQGDIVLVPTYGRYAFENEQLEDLSAVEKVLIRMGPAHAAVVKEKAKELRSLIASQVRK